MEARISNQNDKQRAQMHALHSECLSTYDKLLERDPADSEAFMHMMWARKFACDWSNFGANMDKMVALVEDAVSHMYTYIHTLLCVCV